MEDELCKEQTRTIPKERPLEKNQYLVSYSLNIYSVSSDIFLGFSSAPRKLSLKSGYFSYQNLLTGFHVFRWQMLQKKTGYSFFMVTDKLNFFSTSSDFKKKKERFLLWIKEFIIDT